MEKYIKELETISNYPEEFLKKFDNFLVNSNLTSKERTNLIEIIKILKINEDSK